MKFLVLLGALALAFAFTVCCPAKKDIYPCKCARFSGFHEVTCPNIMDDVTLRKAIGGLEGLEKIYKLTIENAVLTYIPHDIFKRTQIRKLFFRSSSIMSLSDTDIAFEGLGNVLDMLQFRECNFMTSLDFSQLKQMERLRIFSIVGGDLESIYENMQEMNHLNLQQVSFSNNKISYISDYAFSNFTNLEFLSLKENLVSELKRTMLPKPAEKLEQIILADNQIQDLPENFFEEMPILDYIDLSMNKLLILKEETFAPVWSQLRKFYANDNSISCDCRMKWVLEKDAPKEVEAVCYWPKMLRGKSLLDLESKELWC